jgi:predicted class III extradiol MEMO1 family dioxygenase
MSKVRQPAVAGSSYPADAGRLREMIGRFMQEVETPVFRR